METPDQPQVTAATPEALVLVDAHLGNPGIPQMHHERFAVQAEGRGQYLVAWRGGVPVGNVLLHFRHPPHHASFERFGDCAYVEALDVKADARRLGFGLALMRAAEAAARARGAALVGLSVGVDNAPARALYRQLGYQPTDIPDYFVSWTYLHPETGEPMEEGEVCSFWLKPLT
jgi:ribosomal protein S18 acetylase RimI-like enzyme